MGTYQKFAEKVGTTSTLVRVVAEKCYKLEKAEKQ